jgi:hypothetical protein
MSNRGLVVVLPIYGTGGRSAVDKTFCQQCHQALLVA